ncbi:MAG: hypothetical protein AMXMBFR16_10450 [Candidatus Uhrbacteria bacterium]
MTVYNGMVHWRASLMCVVDIETTGRIAGWHEIVQIAILPVDAEFNIIQEVRPFYQNIAPEFPERSEAKSLEISGLKLDELAMSAPDKWKAADYLDDWFERINLPLRKSMIPLAHNWAFESAFLKAWLGLDSFDAFFHNPPRDSMLLALSINDMLAIRGELAPFQSCSLPNLCKQFGIPHDNAHDALADCISTAQVYKTLLNWRIP